MSNESFGVWSRKMVHGISTALDACRALPEVEVDGLSFQDEEGSISMIVRRPDFGLAISRDGPFSCQPLQEGEHMGEDVMVAMGIVRSVLHGGDARSIAERFGVMMSLGAMTEEADLRGWDYTISRYGARRSDDAGNRPLPPLWASIQYIAPLPIGKLHMVEGVGVNARDAFSSAMASVPVEHLA